MKKLILLIVLSFVGVLSVATIKGKITHGIATYYHNKFNGRKTASGEVFNQAKMTGASNDFALNTLLKVTNLVNGKYVVVRINDRMALSSQRKGRVVDLTTKAAKQLGFFGEGMTRVKVEQLDTTDENI